MRIKRRKKSNQDTRKGEIGIIGFLVVGESCKAIVVPVQNSERELLTVLESH